MLKTIESPSNPAIERIKRIRKGLRPPVVSVIAEKGMRKIALERVGIDTSKPIMVGVRFIKSAKSLEKGLNTEIMVKPVKKPIVEPTNARDGRPSNRNRVLSSPIVFSGIFS